MAVVLKKSRKFTFEYVEKDPKDGKEKVEASFDFEFPFSEDKEYSALAAELRERLIPDAKTDGDIEKNRIELNLIASRATAKDTRKCLKACKGIDLEIEDTDELTPCVITLEDGTIDDIAQKIAFEFIYSQPGLKEKIMLARAGISIKNL